MYLSSFKHIIFKKLTSILVLISANSFDHCGATASIMFFFKLNSVLQCLIKFRSLYDQSVLIITHFNNLLYDVAK